MQDCVKHSGVGGKQQQQQQQQQSPNLIFDIGTNSQPEQRTTNRMLIADYFVRMRPNRPQQCTCNANKSHADRNSWIVKSQLHTHNKRKITHAPGAGV
jgi:hypothetical protein